MKSNFYQDTSLNLNVYIIEETSKSVLLYKSSKGYYTLPSKCYYCTHPKYHKTCQWSTQIFCTPKDAFYKSHKSMPYLKGLIKFGGIPDIQEDKNGGINGKV